jgi:hypothetical protein
VATARAYAPLGTVSNSTTLNVAFTGTQPVAGDKIIIVFWVFNSTVSPTISSVKDNATSQNTYSFVASSIVSQGGGINWEAVWCYYLDLPATATWSGNYTATITFGETEVGLDGGGAAYIGVSPGASTATNNATGVSAAANSGNITPVGNGLYVGGLTDSSGANPATATPGGGFTNEVVELDGATHEVGALADILEGNGTKAASWTLEGSLIWNALVAFWPDAPGGTQPTTPKTRMARLGLPWLRAELPFFSQQRYVPPKPATVVIALPIFATGRLVRVTSTPRSKSTLAQPGPLPSAPRLARESLVRIVRTPRGQSMWARAGPLPQRGTSSVERLVRTVATSKGRASVAGPGPVSLAPTRARTVLKQVVATPRGRAGRAQPGPLPLAPVRLVVGKLMRTVQVVKGTRSVTFAPVISLAPIRARTALKQAVRLVRGAQTQVARVGPLPLAAIKTSAGRLVRTLPVARSRTVAVPAVVSTVVVRARTSLKQIVRLVPGGRAARAGAAVAAVAPFKATGRLVRTLPALRGRSTVSPMFAPPLVVRARTALKAVIRTPLGRARVAGAAVLPGRPIVARTALKYPVRVVRYAGRQTIGIFGGILRDVDLMVYAPFSRWVMGQASLRWSVMAPFSRWVTGIISGRWRTVAPFSRWAGGPPEDKS